MEGVRLEGTFYTFVCMYVWMDMGVCVRVRCAHLLP